MRPTPIHLVGSIPLANAEAVFSTVARILGARVSRIPDGETGERSNWIAWQLPLLQAHPQLEPDPDSRTLAREAAAIARAIPARRLAIQWDVCMEVIACEGRLSVPGGKPREFTFGQLARLCAMAPADAEVGIHLCYGDPGHKHIVEPGDARILTDLTNGIAEAAGRTLAWFHLPVPKQRHDATFFEPLKQLRLPPETQLYLGLVHFTDQEDGARRRVAAAREALPDFGIATECGFGRRPAHTVVPLLELHERVAGEIAV